MFLEQFYDKEFLNIDLEFRKALEAIAKEFYPRRPLQSKQDRREEAARCDEILSQTDWSRMPPQLAIMCMRTCGIYRNYLPDYEDYLQQVYDLLIEKMGEEEASHRLRGILPVRVW